MFGPGRDELPLIRSVSYAHGVAAGAPDARGLIRGEAPFCDLRGLAVKIIPSSVLFRSGFDPKQNSTIQKNWLICRLTKIAGLSPRLSIVQN